MTFPTGITPKGWPGSGTLAKVVTRSSLLVDGAVGCGVDKGWDARPSMGVTANGPRRHVLRPYACPPLTNRAARYASPFLTASAAYAKGRLSNAMRVSSIGRGFVPPYL